MTDEIDTNVSDTAPAEPDTVRAPRVTGRRAATVAVAAAVAVGAAVPAVGAVTRGGDYAPGTNVPQPPAADETGDANDPGETRTLDEGAGVPEPPPVDVSGAAEPAVPDDQSVPAPDEDCDPETGEPRAAET